MSVFMVSVGLMGAVEDKVCLAAQSGHMLYVVCHSYKVMLDCHVCLGLLDFRTFWFIDLRCIKFNLRH